MAAEVVAPLVDLSNGNKMPMGTWESQPCDIKEAVKYTVKAGHRWVWVGRSVWHNLSNQI